MDEAIIEIERVTKRYEDVTAVNNVSLTIQKGEIFGLLGPNGAGKSTTILMLLGLSEPTSGTIRVCGMNSTRQPLAVKKRVGYLPDDLGFYYAMTGVENLVYTGLLNGMSKQVATKRALSLLDKVGLSHAASKKTSTYSRGMRQRLGLADVLMKDPEIIILDEPTLGIDPKGVKQLLQFIRTLNKEENVTVLLSSHHLHQVQQICDRVGLFVSGQLLATGDIHSLVDQLFSEQSIIIYVEASPMTNELKKKIAQLHGVISVNDEKKRWEIHCQKDITDQIAHTVIKSGAKLTHVSKKDYGLDELYDRYFEGSDITDEQ